MSVTTNEPSDRANPNQWRNIMAALANPDTRRVAAKLMLGEEFETASAEFTPSKRRKVTAAIEKSGLVDPETGSLNESIFREALASGGAQPAKQRGIERFLHGKLIIQYPANSSERAELLSWVAAQAFGPAEVLSEKDVNERLRPFTDDVAELRRYLVDHGLVYRSPDGAQYSRRGPERCV
ncbi:MAG: DUF2087 domain-containing protein [Ancrocorticia sp.]|uniref:DUF2087 domain-containing protein n=1 Tax=Ancrocorticia sp. TaxID=2593684 RepID=UPI003F8F88E3